MKSESPVDNTGKDIVSLVGTDYNEFVYDK